MYDLVVNTAINGMLFLNDANMVMLYKRPGVIIAPIANLLGVMCNYLFNFVSGIFSNGTLGITIILFTIVVKILLLPLSAYSAKSMAKMRVLQPEIKKIQEKYKGKTDVEAKQRMNAEITEFQRKNGANMFSGCLPTLMQLPIIYALFFILQRVYLYIDTIGALYNQISDTVLKIPDIGPKITPIVESISQLKRFVSKDAWFDLSYADNCNEVVSKMGADSWNTILASAPENIVNELNPLLLQKENIEYFFGINLVEKPSLFSISIIICILSAVTTFLSSWILNKAQGPSTDENVRMQQKTMLITMPLITGFFSYSMPAGIGIYWVMGNIVQIVQQYIFNKIFTNNTVVSDKKSVDEKLKK